MKGKGREEEKRGEKGKKKEGDKRKQPKRCQLNNRAAKKSGRIKIKKIGANKKQDSIKAQRKTLNKCLWI